MGYQTLGNYRFEWDPDKATMPESYKTVALQPTYSGSAIFQWDALLEGAMVTLEWNWMSDDQYNALRALYLSTDLVKWNPREGDPSFFVYVVSLSGEYFPVALGDIGYRAEVKMQLQIRTQGGTVTTTTSTTATSA